MPVRMSAAEIQYYLHELSLSPRHWAIFWAQLSGPSQVSRRSKDGNRRESSFLIATSSEERTQLFEARLILIIAYLEHDPGETAAARAATTSGMSDDTTTPAPTEGAPPSATPPGDQAAVVALLKAQHQARGNDLDKPPPQFYRDDTWDYDLHHLYADGQLRLRSGPALLQLDLLQASARPTARALSVISHGAFRRILRQIARERPVVVDTPGPPTQSPSQEPATLRRSTGWLRPLHADHAELAAAKAATRLAASSGRAAGTSLHWPLLRRRVGAQGWHGAPPRVILPGGRRTTPRGRRRSGVRGAQGPVRRRAGRGSTGHATRPRHGAGARDGWRGRGR
jgi:hypothetical protein